MPERHETAAGHGMHGHGTHGAHGMAGGQHGTERAGHDKHAGHDPEQFRRKFWLSLALTIPIVVTSEMVMDWFGYSVSFPGMSLVGPVLGTIVFVYGGWPFLAGHVRRSAIGRQA
jgi:Cu2+-exporting ATPase